MYLHVGTRSLGVGMYVRIYLRTLYVCVYTFVCLRYMFTYIHTDFTREVKIAFIIARKEIM